jgi:hypothetical protein
MNTTSTCRSPATCTGAHRRNECPRRVPRPVARRGRRRVRTGLGVTAGAQHVNRALPYGESSHAAPSPRPQPVARLPDPGRLRRHCAERPSVPRRRQQRWIKARCRAPAGQPLVHGRAASAWRATRGSGRGEERDLLPRRRHGHLNGHRRAHFAGQQPADPGEENSLSFENFPNGPGPHLQRELADRGLGGHDERHDDRCENRHRGFGVDEALSRGDCASGEGRTAVTAGPRRAGRQAHGSDQHRASDPRHARRHLCLHAGPRLGRRQRDARRCHRGGLPGYRHAVCGAPRSPESPVRRRRQRRHRGGDGWRATAFPARGRGRQARRRRQPRRRLAGGVSRRLLRRGQGLAGGGAGYAAAGPVRRLAHGLRTAASRPLLHRTGPGGDDREGHRPPRRRQRLPARGRGGAHRPRPPRGQRGECPE